MKHPFVLFAAFALLASSLAAPGVLRVAAAATPPPTPPPLSAPTATPPPLLPPGTGSLGPAEATPTPPPGDENRKGIEGVWEVQIQTIDTTEYVHWKLLQSGGTTGSLTGVYLDKDGKSFPLAGALDGKTVDIVVSLKDGTSLIFKAQLEGTTDMLGMMTSGSNSVAFTAAYRPKYKFIDNLSPGTGGITGNGGGGMYSPKPKT